MVIIYLAALPQLGKNATKSFSPLQRQLQSYVSCKSISTDTGVYCPGLLRFALISSTNGKLKRKEKQIVLSMVHFLSQSSHFRPRSIEYN